MSSSVKTLVISDIHLGSTLSNSQKVVDFLKQASFGRLILLGDIFDGTHVYEFKKEDWHLLDYLVDLGKGDKEVVWVKGNHDVVDTQHVPQLKDVNFVESYNWQQSGRTYCAIHGQQFDNMSVKNESIKKVTGKLHSIFASYVRHKKVAGALERFHTYARGLSKIIADGAIDYAIKNNTDYIFCAHTHVPMNKEVKSESGKTINYFNTGSWIHEPFSYITIDELGVVSLLLTKPLV